MRLRIAPCFRSRRALSDGGFLLSVAYDMTCFMRFFKCYKRCLENAWMRLSIVPLFRSRRAVWNGGLLLSVAYDLTCFMRFLILWSMPNTSMIHAQYIYEWCPIHLWLMANTSMIDAQYIYVWCPTHLWMMPNFIYDWCPMHLWWMPNTSMIGAQYIYDWCSIHLWLMPNTSMIEYGSRMDRGWIEYGSRLRESAAQARGTLPGDLPRGTRPWHEKSQATESLLN